MTPVVNSAMEVDTVSMKLARIEGMMRRYAADHPELDLDNLENRAIRVAPGIADNSDREEDKRKRQYSPWNSNARRTANAYAYAKKHQVSYKAAARVYHIAEWRIYELIKQLRKKRGEA